MEISWEKDGEKGGTEEMVNAGMHGSLEGGGVVRVGEESSGKEGQGEGVVREEEAKLFSRLLLLCFLDGESGGDLGVGGMEVVAFGSILFVRMEADLLLSVLLLLMNNLLINLSIKGVLLLSMDLFAVGLVEGVLKGTSSLCTVLSLWSFSWMILASPIVMSAVLSPLALPLEL